MNAYRIDKESEVFKQMLAESKNRVRMAQESYYKKVDEQSRVKDMLRIASNEIELAVQRLHLATAEYDDLMNRGR